MLKARGNSYDGKGNAVVKAEADAALAFEQLCKTSDRVCIVLVITSQKKIFFGMLYQSISRPHTAACVFMF